MRWVISVILTEAFAVQELNEVHQQLSRTTNEMYETVAAALLQKVCMSCCSHNHTLLSFCIEVSLKATPQNGSFKQDDATFNDYFAPRMGAKYCDEYVYLSARITRKPHGQTLPKFLCLLPIAATRSYSGGIAMYFRFCGWHHFFKQWCVMCINKRR